MENNLFLLSPERADQCCGLVEPNTVYEVTELNHYRGGMSFAHFIMNNEHHCEALHNAGHLINGGRWLLLERLPR